MLFVRGSAWLVATVAAIYVIIFLRTGRTSATHLSMRWLWTTALVLHLVHVLLAFHFVHGWSHAAAVQHTAERTEAVFSIYFGGGIYFNHAFAVAWLLDVAGIWFAAWKNAPQRALSRNGSARFVPLARRVWHVYFGGMMWFATVVFAERVLAITSGLVFIALGALWWRSRAR